MYDVCISQHDSLAEARHVGLDDEAAKAVEKQAASEGDGRRQVYPRQMCPPSLEV